MVFALSREVSPLAKYRRATSGTAFASAEHGDRFHVSIVRRDKSAREQPAADLAGLCSALVARAHFLT